MSKQSKIIFEIEGGEDVTVFAVGGENVLELARRAGVQIDAPCSGNGTCGKCAVIIHENDKQTRQLACQSTVSGDAEIHVPKPQIQAAQGDGVIVHLRPAGQGDGSSVLSSDKTDEPSHFGLAVDIGTTTVAAMLVDLNSGFVFAKAVTGNAQISYGADVINRIIEQQKPDGIRKLQHAIVELTLLPLIDKLCAAVDISRDKITRLTVAANTTMNHLLLGIDANSIRVEPYEPAFLEFEPRDPSSIGISLALGAEMILAPNIGSYVGGDITAGVLSALTPSEDKIWNRPEMSLLIDLGTNGEIVFGNEEFLMACACSAGPAFEGGDISCGMRAANGAIEAFILDKECMEPSLSVINDFPPAGLCGSGLIDVVAELFRAGIINGKGKFNTISGTQGDGSPLHSGRIRHDEYGVGSYVLVSAADSATDRDITITETDIDNFIRAKGAIFSGIMSLLAPLGFTPADIDDVMIAGGIGSGINIKNAVSIGMLPDLPEEKYSYIGNSSLNGAYEMLINPEAEEKVKEIAGNMTYIDLSSQPGYMDEFIAACFLPHTDERLFSIR